MTDEGYIEYRNLRFRDPIFGVVSGALQDWQAELFGQEYVLARKMDADFEFTVRSGTVKQPGARATRLNVVDGGKAGDYIALLPSRKTAVPAALFEKTFVRSDRESAP